MHCAPCGSRIEPSTPATQEECRSGRGREQPRPALLLPSSQRAFGRYPEWHGPFATPFPEHTYHPTGVVDIVDVQSAQFRHTNTSRIKQLDNSLVTQCN